MKQRTRTLVWVLALASIIRQASAQFWYDLDYLISYFTSPLICSIYSAFRMIAGGLGIVIIVLAGIKWMSSGDDPPSRKVAKDMVIHTIVALIIIVLATLIVDIASGGNLSSCP